MHELMTFSFAVSLPISCIIALTQLYSLFSLIRSN